MTGPRRRITGDLQPVEGPAFAQHLHHVDECPDVACLYDLDARGGLVDDPCNIDIRGCCGTSVAVNGNVKLKGNHSFRTNDARSRNRCSPHMHGNMKSVLLRRQHHRQGLADLIGAGDADLADEPAPWPASSAKSDSTKPCSRSTAPACTVAPSGCTVWNALCARMARALTPAGSVGRPGRCGSPAEMSVVTPPLTCASIQPIVESRGVKSPNTGWTWGSMSPGTTVPPERQGSAGRRPSRSLWIR